MGVLVRGLAATLGALAAFGAVVALGGCYSPALRDCTVSCTGPGDCASGQVCSTAGLCVSPGSTSSCGTAAPDAPAAIDAGARDASPPRDAVAVDAELDAAVAMVSLHVQLSGRGSIVVPGAGTCTHDCMYQVAAGVALTVHAVDDKDMFARWTSLVCAGQGPTCTFTPIMATSIAAQFDKMQLDVR